MDRLEATVNKLRRDVGVQQETISITLPSGMQEKIDALRTLLHRIDERLDDLEAQQNRAVVLPNVPLNAQAGKLIVVTQDINLYIGAGQANPLRKIPTQAV